MVNGVLVERSVGDVLPALQTNSDGLKKVLEDLLKQYQTKQTEMEKWKVSSMREIAFASQMLMQCTEKEQHPDCSAIINI
jgi:polyhydroxyalkanoate synthesis regulator phasin